MPECSFCHKSYEFPHGLTLVLNDGTVLYFCSGKCRKNWKMGRKSKRVTWIRKTKKTSDEMIEEVKPKTEKVAEEKEATAEVGKKKKEKTEEKKEEKKKEEKNEEKK